MADDNWGLHQHFERGTIGRYRFSGGGNSLWGKTRRSTALSQLGHIMEEEHLSGGRARLGGVGA